MPLTTSAKIVDDNFTKALDAFGELYGQILRKLYVDLYVRKHALNLLKSSYIVKYGITARHFNAIRYDLQGKIASIIEVKKTESDSKKRKIQNIEKKIKKILNEQNKKTKLKKTFSKLSEIQKIKNEIKQLDFKVHNYNRKLNRLNIELLRVKKQVENPSICFGSKKAFKKQFQLKKNDYKNHQEWKDDWQELRSNSIFILGSYSESFGNQTCQFNNGELQLRLPNALLKFCNNPKKNTITTTVNFTYLLPELEMCTFKDKASRSAVSYRFSKNIETNTWYCHASFDYKVPPIISRPECGRIGIDLNADHFAVAHVSHDGNLIKSWDIPFNFYKNRKTQITAKISMALHEIIQYNFELDVPVPIVIEKLDFAKKKDEIKSRSMNRMLSSFAYSKFKEQAESLCMKKGIALYKVNPAYTSIIGKFKFGFGYGLSIHRAAAFAIARRSMNLGESLRMKAKKHLPLPARNRGKHVWSDWRSLNRVAKKYPQDVFGWPLPRSQPCNESYPLNPENAFNEIPF